MSIIYKKVESEQGILKICYDEITESPREWDNLGRMVCFHRRYSLGDDHNYHPSDYGSWEEVKEAIEKDYDVAVILPLYMYDHSGITISTNPFSCPWDSGQIGWIFATKEDIRKEFGVKRVSKKMIERAEEILLAEVEIYDSYLRGEVYGYIVEDKEGNVIDSCWGFYSIKDMKEYVPEEFKNLLNEVA